MEGGSRWRHCRRRGRGQAGRQGTDVPTLRTMQSSETRTASHSFTHLCNTFPHLPLALIPTDPTHINCLLVQVLNVDQESRAWLADTSNYMCDRPGSWYCPGQYPPKLPERIGKGHKSVDYNKHMRGREVGY